MNTDIASDVLRPRIFAIEKEMREFEKVDLATVDLRTIDENKYYFCEWPVKYYHGGGIFTGELFIPKGSIIVGKIHKYENLNVMTKGELSVLVGNEIKRIKAPYVVVAAPGTKRIAFAHEDAIWMTFHATNESDPKEVEKYFIAQNEQEYLEHAGQLSLPIL